MPFTASVSSLHQNQHILRFCFLIFCTIIIVVEIKQLTMLLVFLIYTSTWMAAISFNQLLDKTSDRIEILTILFFTASDCRNCGRGRRRPPCPEGILCPCPAGLLCPCSPAVRTEGPPDPRPGVRPPRRPVLRLQVRLRTNECQLIE